MKSFTSFFVILTIFASCAFAQQQTVGENKTSKGIFYRISGNGMSKPSYILGSMHTVPGDFVWKLPKFDSIMRNVNMVVCEIKGRELYDNIYNSLGFNSKQLEDALIQRMEEVYTDSNGNILSFIDDLPANNQEIMRKLLPGYFFFKNPEEWNAPYILKNIQERSLLRLQAIIRRQDSTLSYYTEPIDMYMIDSIAPRYNLATAQLDDNNVLGFAQQAPLALNQLLAGKKARKDYSLIVYNVIALYYNILQGTSKEIKAYLNMEESPATTVQKMAPEAEKILLDDRNTKWMKKIVPMLQKGPTFFVVGAAHLHDTQNTKGLLHRLQNLGYIIEKI